MLLLGDLAHGLGIASMAVGRRSGAARAAVHRSDQHGGCAAQAGLGDVDLQIGLVGGLRFDVGLRPTGLRVVVDELDEEIISLLHLAEHLVQAQGIHEGLHGLAGLGVIGNRDSGLEEDGEQLSPTDIAAAIAVGDGGVAGDEDGGCGRGRGDLDGAQRGVRTDYFDGELVVPIARVASVELIQTHLFAAGGVGWQLGQMRRADVGGKGALGDLAGWDLDALQHQAARLRLERGCGRGSGVAKGHRHVEVALRHFGGKEKWLVAGGGVAVVADGDLRAGFVAVACVVRVDGRGSDSRETGLGGAGAEIELQIHWCSKRCSKRRSPWRRPWRGRWRCGRRGLCRSQGRADQSGATNESETAEGFHEVEAFRIKC